MYMNVYLVSVGAGVKEVNDLLIVELQDKERGSES